MRKRVLIAEDDSVTRELLSKHATLRGYDVVSVADGLEYIAAVSKEDFDAVITDLMMPELNGASATDIMKLNGDTTPIIAITALSETDVSHIQCKFARVYRKPIDANELFDYIESIL
jgi:CheY-like chemotaxis protein